MIKLDTSRKEELTDISIKDNSDMMLKIQYEDIKKKYQEIADENQRLR